MKSINKVINDKQNNLNTAVLPTASTKHQDMNRQRTHHRDTPKILKQTVASLTQHEGIHKCEFKIVVKPNFHDKHEYQTQVHPQS